LNTFSNLGLPEPLLKAISALGFETPSAIQEQGIPILLNDDTDFIGLAQTGTGKTAAFGLPLLTHIDPDQGHTQALILAPTRELCQQIAGQMEAFAKFMPGLKTLAVYGGAAILPQLQALKKPVHVLIATPGRLIDLMDRKAAKLNKLRYVILDEADEMLNFGFKEDIDTILETSPDDLRTWLFSATLSPDIQSIVDHFMVDPKEIRLSRPNEANDQIEHQYCLVMPKNKPEALCRFLDTEPDMRGIVFCRTKIDTQQLSDQLGPRGYRVDALHGDLSQQQRDRVTNKFRRNELQLLIATDVAARGLDVQDLTHVFHLNIPDDFAYYTHRAGRTARAGKEGISLAMISPRDESRLNQLSKRLRVDFAKVEVPDAKDIMRGRIRHWTERLLTMDTGTRKNNRLLTDVLEDLSELSREELIHRVLLLEFDKLQSHSNQDLNATPEKYRESRHQGGGRSGGKNSRFRPRQDSRGGGGGSQRDRDGSKSHGFKKRFRK
jgi:ATP-dependent RNA helicase DeaD